MAVPGKRGVRALVANAASATAGISRSARGVASASTAVIIVAVVAMLIVPLPTWLLDLLITANLAASVAVLLGAAYAKDAQSIAALPSILLLTTLFRLGLNVSTVRLILLQANAGRVVSAFGGFVVRGDYVVGLAVFLILTIVQYVVIARGAERVAEVAARFTLDAMPGQQLAIDADLRAGAIDAGEARRRRGQLSREARLYGALDGAMRFVKGDAMAAILILCVSLAGGLLIGVLRRNMPVAEAARLYTLLTIGDGLVSQIPALLLSTAAGLVVTRVDGDDEAEGAHAEAATLGRFVARPRLLLAVAALLGLLALLPGLPLLPFAAVALAFAGAGVVLLQRSTPGHRPASLLPPAPPAVEILLHSALTLSSISLIEQALSRQFDRTFSDLGLPREPLVITPAAHLPARGFRIRIRGATVSEGLVDERDPDPAATLAAALEAALRKNAADLLGLDETQRLVDALALRAPALVREVVPRRVDLPTLAGLLRRFLAEAVPLGDLREILEALAALQQIDKDPTLLAERLRRTLRRRITGRVAPDLTLLTLVLDPLVEEALKDAIRPGPGQSPVSTLALEPEMAGDILAALSVALSELDGVPPVIVTSPELRRHVRRLVESDHPEVQVVSWQELLPEVRVEPIGRISVS